MLMRPSDGCYGEVADCWSGQEHIVGEVLFNLEFKISILISNFKFRAWFTFPYKISLDLVKEGVICHHLGSFHQSQFLVCVREGACEDQGEDTQTCSEWLVGHRAMWTLIVTC